jgi:hypothetical protein
MTAESIVTRVRGSGEVARVSGTGGVNQPVKKNPSKLGGFLRGNLNG